MEGGGVVMTKQELSAAGNRNERWDFVLMERSASMYHRRMDDMTRDHGQQPLEALMERWGLSGHQLVETSEEQLNHKQVQRARKGRQLTLHLMQKVTRAVNDAIFKSLPEAKRADFVPYLHRHLFNYAKGHDAAWSDPNEALWPK
jgi:hypothetical protein